MNYDSLLRRLNPACHRALEEAAALTLTRKHIYVEIEHLFMALLQDTDLDLHAILKHYEIDASRFQSELTRLLDRLRPTFVDVPEFSDTLIELLDQSWKFVVSLNGEGPIRSGHLFATLLTARALERHPLATCRLLAGLDPRRLRLELEDIIRGTSEDPTFQEATLPPAEPGEAAPAAPAGAAGSKTPALDRFTIDLTQQARDGKIDPILGRDNEIRLVIDILTRRRQNNPILTGEAGVGKTAVVEGFALRVAAGDVPPPLRNIVIRTLDLGLLQAGAGVRGEFENRLKSVIEEVRNSAVPIILFIDEAHTLIGAGGAAGQGDAANLLKPALARGGLRVIAATTWSEYKKYFEKDAALARRFQVVKVEQPDVPTAIAMVRGLLASLERHHGVLIQADAVEQAVKLSDRYISGRQLPDKAVSLIDTVCARVSLSQHATPAAVEDCQRKIEEIQSELEQLNRETLVGTDHQERIDTLTALREATEAKLTSLNEKWEHEKRLVEQIREVRAELHNRETPPDEARRAELLKQHHELRNELHAAQGDDPLVHAAVDGMAIAETVCSWTGIPLGRMVADEMKTVLNLRDLMETSVVGQSHALSQIAQSIQSSRANLTDPGKPIGVFLLAGTSGVGKTETAITLANLLYGGEQNMTVINMTEFKEEHKVSLLMGAPPGYVGYGEGGVLTEAVRRKPYSVVLLDEMEKAHPGVQDIFYQVFDKGTMKDGEGRDIDFRNTVILMTTNAGSDLIKSMCSDFDLLPDPDVFTKSVFPELLKTFKAAFLGRVNIIPYYPLSPNIIDSIIRLKLNKIVRRMRDHYRAPLKYTEDLIQAVAARCNEGDTGARNIDNILTRSLLPELSTAVLSRMADGQPITEAEVKVTEDGRFVCAVR